MGGIIVRMKKKLLSAFGCLLIVAGGIALAILLSLVPVGYSDAEAATIGRKYFYGLPFPHYTAPGETIMGSFGQAVRLFPFNAAFWTVVVVFLSFIPKRKINWKRIIGVLLVDVVLFGVPAALVWWSDLNVKPSTLSNPTVQASQFPNDEARKARELELRNRIFKYYKDSNPNGLTADDIDMTGWEEADRKTNEGDFAVIFRFFDDVWKRSNEKKLASEGKSSAK